MQRNWRKLTAAAAIGIIAIAGAAWGTARLWLGGTVAPQPALASMPPLPPVARSSVVVTPIAITLTAIKDALEIFAPPELSDKLDVSQMPLLADADVTWSVARGPFTVTSQVDSLAISTSLNGGIRASGPATNSGDDSHGRPRNLSGLLGNILGRLQNRLGEPGSAPETTGTIQGDATIIAHPVLLPQWRIEPNLKSEVRIADATLSLMGRRIRVPEIAKRLLDRAIDARVSVLQARLRDDPSLQLAVQQQWAQMCRSVPLGSAAPDLPDLWLEVRPTRAFAAHPDVNQDAVLLTIGVEADTRIVPNETKPDCPFPQQLEIVPQLEQGRLAIAVPIDIPFTEVTRLVEAKLKGKTFPQDNSGAFSATIKSVNLAASGDRLLVSVAVRANETRSWLGLGADATVHVWGRPVLDRERQMLRLNDVALDVESQAALGLLGAAAHAAIPSLEKALADNAVIDLVPVVDSARRNIAAAVADFRKSSDIIAVDAEVTGLRLADLQFDAKTLRIIAEADGTVRASVTRLQPVAVEAQ
jgi:hypothetical protein